MVSSKLVRVRIVAILLLLAMLAPSLGVVLEASGQAGSEYVFHDYERLWRDLHDLADQYPDLMELTTLGGAIDIVAPHAGGHTHRQLWNARLTNFANETGMEERAVIYIDGGHHGNEQAGSETAFLLVKYLLEGYGSDERVTRILDRSQVYITPMMNPDGNAHDTRFNTNHVDLNRNYPFQWESEQSVWGDHGSGPASEPEVAANVAFMRALDIDLYLTEHTGIVLLIYAWSYTYDRPVDWPLYETAGGEIEELYGIPNRQASSGLYTAAGTSKDFGYGDALAPSWTFEVDEEQFNPISDEPVEERLAEILSANLHLMDIAARGLYQPVPGLVQVSRPSTVEVGGPFPLTFELNNTGYGYIENGTARLTTSTGLKVDVRQQLFTLLPLNTTTISFSLEALEAGEQSYDLELEYHPLMIRNQTDLSSSFEGMVKVEDNTLLDQLASPAGILGLAVLVALIAVVLKRQDS